MVYKDSSDERKASHLTYSGAWHNGKPEGFGTMFYTGHARYHGQWNNGQCHGEAVYVFLSHDHETPVAFMGQYRPGLKYSGTLTMQSVSNEYSTIVYTGKFVNGKFEDENAVATIKNQTSRRRYKEGKSLDKPALQDDHLDILI